MAFFGNKSNGKGTNGAAIPPPQPIAPPAAAASPAPAQQSAQPPKAASPEANALTDPAIRKQLADARTKVQAAVGQIVLAMASLPRYRNQMLGDVQNIVLDPLMRDRIAIASEKTDSPDAMQSLAGIAFWATVSADVVARIRVAAAGARSTLDS